MSKIFPITLEENARKIFHIEAETELEALEKAEKLYEEGKLTVDPKEDEGGYDLYCYSPNADKVEDWKANNPNDSYFS